MRDIFAAELRLNSAFFFFGTRSRSSSERACWIVDVRSVFVFCFCFPMFVYLLKTVPYCTYPSRVKSLQYIRRPSSYKPHQPLSSFPACLAKHPFPFLPEIRSLRQVANELYGHIYSALATHFYAVIYLHHEDIDGHLLRLYHFNAVTSTSGHQWSRYTFKICGRFCSCPTDHTFLRPRRKTLCHDHLEQIFNTSNVEILHHLVLAT